MTAMTARLAAAFDPLAWAIRWWGARARAGVTRFRALDVPAGATRELPLMPGRMVVHCRRGELWITHDGDPRDVILRERESFAVDRKDRRLTAHALRGDGVVEIEWVRPDGR